MKNSMLKFGILSVEITVLWRSLMMISVLLFGLSNINVKSISMGPVFPCTAFFIVLMRSNFVIACNFSSVTLRGRESMKAFRAVRTGKSHRIPLLMECGAFYP